MHIAATSPLAMSESDLDADLVDREKKIISEQLISEGKPADIAEKILSGKLKKFYEENTLLNQKFVMDPDCSVRNILEKITNTCKYSDNLMPFIIAAAKEHATIGEIIEAMKNEFGEWQETVGF